MNEDTAIRIRGLWKHYGFPYMHIVRHYYRGVVKGKFKNLFQKPSEDYIWALKDISIDVKRGEMLGIIGRNGAGKSTLLKVLAGVTPVSKGSVEVFGRTFPMMELNAGIQWDLTGRENAEVLGAIMGLSRSEIRDKMPAMREFSELGDWFDQPVRTYSSGMLSRLGFTVAAHTDAEIMLVDEVLSVGDIAFRQKCMNWLDDHRGNMTVLFVSHSMGQVERLCDRVLYLEKGEVRFIGNVKDAASLYWEEISDQIMKQMHQRFGTRPLHLEGTGALQIVDAKLLKSSGEPSTKFNHREDIHVRVEFKVMNELKSPNITITVLDSNMIPVAHTTTLGKIDRPDFMPGISSLDCCLKGVQLLKGAYTIDVDITDYRGNIRVGGMRNIAQFQIIESAEDFNMVDAGYFALPAQWHFERIATGNE